MTARDRSVEEAEILAAVESNVDSVLAQVVISAGPLLDTLSGAEHIEVCARLGDIFTECAKQETIEAMLLLLDGNPWGDLSDLPFFGDND